ncbi:MAG: 50S ribosomal protein L10, partial [Coriobacteriia bacterium]|nr:50S ribosomal protein L10 [Coriobacteriia bacterium]
HMPTQAKGDVVAEIKGRLTAAGGVIMADFRGLTVKEMQELRIKVREAGGEVKVYKNTLTEIAVRELALPDLGEFLQGPTAFVFAGDDPVAPAKALVDFKKKHNSLELKGGLVQNAVVDSAGIKAIAALPSREELIAKLMGSMLNPIRGLMYMANAPATSFARALQAVADQKAAA